MVRKKLAPEVIAKMLREHAASLPQCRECFIGPVIEIPTDAAGCNWKVSRIQGSHCIDCLEAMAEFTALLKAGSTLDRGDDMDPTLLTTWAMQR